jgi:hypothetical protein
MKFSLEKVDILIEIKKIHFPKFCKEKIETCVSKDGSGITDAPEVCKMVWTGPGTGRRYGEPSQPLGDASGAVVLPLPGFLREAASADGKASILSRLLEIGF